MKDKLLHIIKNKRTKYFIVILLFIVLMLFAKNKNIIYYLNIRSQKVELERTKNAYIEEIKQDSLNIDLIQKNLDAAERLGREKYFMKRDNEDIYIIRHAEDSLVKIQ